MRSSRKLDFTEEARGDLRTLLRYTNANWGAAQRDTYADRIMRALRDHLVHPHLGSAKDDIAPELRGLRVGQHIAYCRVLEDSVRGERILHVKMDPSRQLWEHP